jgi:hypothetical protein
LATKHAKIKTNWPIRIITKQGGIDGELRTVSNSGIFIHCAKPLRNNGTYRMIMKPSPKLSLEFKGTLILSNPGSIESNTDLSQLALSFVRVPKGDLQRLKNLISGMEASMMEAVKNVKMKLLIKTDRRVVEKEFNNLFDLRLFMNNFFSLPDVADRRTSQSMLRYSGRERRMRA